MLNRRTVLGSGAASLWLAAVAAPRTSFGSEATPSLKPGPLAPPGLDLSGMDRRIRPGNDFFRYVNGGWLERTQIPPDRSSVGIDQQLEDGAQEIIRAILDGPDGSGDSNLAKARCLYRSYLDVASIEALGTRPIRGTMASIRALRTPEAFAGFMGASYGGLGGSLFELSIRPDLKDPDRYAVTVQQGGLGMPDRSYYFDADFAETRGRYRTYVSRLLTLIGWEAPARAAAAILAFETAIAEASWPPSDARDLAKGYNPIAVADLAATSTFPWRSFLSAAGLGQVSNVILGQPSAIRTIAGLVGRTSPVTLRAWVAGRFVNEAAAYLSADFVSAQEAFQEGVLTGATTPAPRWRRGIALVDTMLGEAVGKAYVASTVPAGTKVTVEAMVETLRAAFSARVQRLGWMSPAGRALARDKLARMGRKVAYTDAWRSYERVTTQPGDLFGNVLSARAALWNRQVERLERPVVRGEWFITPQTPNAAYSVSLNELLVTAAELQAPFFHPAADPAVNYGGVGAIIGHEMTHGFDDDGRRFDAAGRMSEPWSGEDAQAFEREAQRLATQLNGTEALPGVFIDGHLTLNEAIADLGGAHVALDAYHLSLGGQMAPIIDGLTGDQRFFLAFAQAWRWKEREPAFRAGLASDPHAPPITRVNGTVRNIDAWYEAFSISPGDALYLHPDQRVRLW